MMADDVVAILVEQALGAAGTTILIGPKGKIDPSVTTLSVIPGGGGAPEGTHNLITAPAYVRPSCQIVARSATLAAAESKALAAFLAIFAVRNRFVNGTWWVSTTMTQSEPFPLGIDELGLERVAFNFTCMKRLSAATS